MSEKYSFDDSDFKETRRSFKKIHDSVVPINFIKIDSDTKSLPDAGIIQTISKEPKVRENWKGRADFFLSILAYAVGLGAVWRFPYLCYKNGGGVFLIPYAIFLMLVGIPLVFLELCVGQFTSTGPLTCWRMVPFFRGIGLSMNIVNGYLCIYYNMILAYSIYFLYLTLASFGSSLPWSKCNSNINPNCFDYNSIDNLKNYTFINCTSDMLKCSSGICYKKLNVFNMTSSCNQNASNLISLGFWKPVFPTESYWFNNVLEKSDGIENGGNLIWQLVLALLVAWILVYLMVVNGIKVSGKLVYFTAIFPYVVLLILGIKGWTLPGASTGLKYYLYPDFSRLSDYSVWIDAGGQIFFTLSVTYGGLIALSSYNTFHTNILRDAILVSFTNCITSFFAGLVVFSYMGYLCNITGQPMDKIVQAGQGLVFVVYPFAVTTLSGSHFWAVLFFIMMLVLGLDTMMASAEALITSVFDMVPKLKEKKINKILTVSAICSILFLIGMIFCQQSGTYWVEIIDYYSGSYAILLVAAIECICVGWIYGFKRFSKDISTMLGSEVTNHWTFSYFYISWCYSSPAILIAVVVFSWVNFKNLELNGYSYPHWSHVLGNIISISTLSGVIIWSIGTLIDALFINKRPLKTLFRPDNGWKPLQAKHRILVGLVHSKENKEETAENKKENNKPFVLMDIEKF